MKNNKLTFGIMVGQIPPWQQIIEQAKLVESLGFDKLWLPDHFVYPVDSKMDWLECWTVLSALATQTEQITLGTIISSMTLRNPALLARMALSVDHISGGRLELGVGAGGAPNCHKMTGAPQWEPRERSERYKEFVEILDQMLGNEVTTYEGKYYNIEGALMRPKFIAKPRPVLNVAAHGPKAIRLAAQHGDAWNSLGSDGGLTPKQSSAITRQRCEKLCEFAIEAGRDPNQIGRTFGFGFTADELFQSSDAFFDTIGRYREAGINDFCFMYLPGLDDWKGKAITTLELLQRVALEDIPALQKAM
jgi:alkanesulfonate monooxygenase SsuD/methylene tetrahydromethanopterin reductase-like flavin-dependent oxidoreductase (luciferase family)